SGGQAERRHRPVRRRSRQHVPRPPRGHARRRGRARRLARDAARPDQEAGRGAVPRRTAAQVAGAFVDAPGPPNRSAEAVGRENPGVSASAALFGGPVPSNGRPPLAPPHPTFLKYSLEPVGSAFIVSLPGVQLAGQTSPCFSANCTAWTTRSASSTD